MMNSIATRLFSTIINMNITAGAVILFVLAARFLLRKAPKIFSYALWIVVLFRLLCPVSISTDISLLGLLDPPAAAVTQHTTSVSYIPQDTFAITISPPSPDTNGAVSESPSQIIPQSPAPSASTPIPLTSLAVSVWLAGMTCMLGYSVVSFLSLRRRLVGAALLRDNIYLADHIDSPFVMGLLRAKIYLPSSLSAQEQGYILLHEQHHIRRLDHIIKALAFLALCIHWFNPLVWIAFVLSSKDMEMSCDEAVMKHLGEDIRSDYSASLLSLATGRRIIAGTPLAFGEGDTRSRIKNVLKWKKPKLWIAILAAAVCVFVIAACAGNPKDSSDTPDTPDISTPEDIVPTPEFTSMEDYVRHRIEQMKTVSYYSDATQGEVTVNVLDVKIGWLEKQGEVFGLAPNGTLEAWSYNILVKPNAEAEDIMLVGGQYEEDGYFDLEGQGGRITVALRSTDGKYNVLYDAVINDGLDFFGYCNTTEEAIHDWYVKEYRLNLPLYAKEWIDCITVPEDGSLSSVPVHRFDGDGWYLYIPVQAWNCPANAEVPCVFTSAYYTGSTLKVDYFDYAPEGLSDDHRKQGFTLIDETNLIWSRSSGGVTSYYYCFEAPNGGCLRVAIEWIDTNITDYPYVAMEPDILRLMAESFTVYGVGDQTDNDTVTCLPVLELTREEYDAICGIVLRNLQFGWWKGTNPMADCTYEASAFECVYQENKGGYIDFYGYAGYFRFDENGDCVEYWYAPSIISLNMEEKIVYDIWWPGDGANYESDILDKFPDEIAEFVAEPNEERYQAILARLLEIAKTRMVPTISGDMKRSLSTLTSEWQHRFDRNEAPLSILRVDENRERELTVEANMLSVFSSVVSNLRQIKQPDSFRALGGGIYIWFDSTRHLAFFAGEEPRSVLIRYVTPDANEAAVVYDPQLYLYLIASAERENVQLHNLDSDGFLEAILWNYSDNDLVIHDYFDDTFHRFSVNETLGCDASDYTGLIANIVPGYDTLVQASELNGTVTLYRYSNGEFTYVCPINEALQ